MRETVLSVKAATVFVRWGQGLASSTSPNHCKYTQDILVSIRIEQGFGYSGVYSYRTVRGYYH